MMLLPEDLPPDEAVMPHYFRAAGTEIDTADAVAADFAVDPAPVEEMLRAQAETAALRECVARAETAFEQGLHAHRTSVASTLEAFEDEKRRYFATVEGEVVRLSLAIAERVLHRESSMDPMLLAGATRVALEQITEGSGAVLRVPTGEADAWEQTLRPSRQKVVIEEDGALTRGDCVLVAQSGTVHLGMRAQLQEIERGFFELLSCRPGNGPGALAVA